LEIQYSRRGLGEIMIYHISWLKSAIEKCSDSSVNGNMTIEEFIKKYMLEELEKSVKVKL
jgi:hypothetical protein